MRKKTKEDEHQSSLDSFASADVPTMPDLDNLTKADKIIRQEKNESINDDALNTFSMPSMTNEPVKTEISANMMFHNLEFNIRYNIYDVNPPTINPTITSVKK